MKSPKRVSPAFACERPPTTVKELATLVSIIRSWGRTIRPPGTAGTTVSAPRLAGLSVTGTSASGEARLNEGTTHNVSYPATSARAAAAAHGSARDRYHVACRVAERLAVIGTTLSIADR